MSCNFIDKLRSPKILNMAIFDWVTNFLGGSSIISCIVFNYKNKLSNIVNFNI